jgi:hypothetical protein
LFRRGEREELGDLKGSSTERAFADRDGGVSKQPFDLILSVFQESIAGGRRWKGVGILGINLRQNGENGAEMLLVNRPLRTWGMSFGSVSPAGYTLCYKCTSGN